MTQLRNDGRVWNVVTLNDTETLAELAHPATNGRGYALVVPASDPPVPIGVVFDLVELIGGGIELRLLDALPMYRPGPPPPRTEPGSAMDVIDDQALTNSVDAELVKQVPELPADLRKIWAPHFVQSGRSIGLVDEHQWAGFLNFCVDMMRDVDYSTGQKPRPF